MKNIDKIKQMDAEDFAEYLINFNRCSKCIHYNKKESECGYIETPVPCIDGVATWLNQEVNPMPEIKIGDIIYSYIGESRARFVVMSDTYANNLRGVMVRWRELDNIWKIARMNDEKEMIEVIWRADNETTLA